jgi:preprotein translocase subunit SecD
LLILILAASWFSCLGTRFKAHGPIYEIVLASAEKTNLSIEDTVNLESYFKDLGKVSNTTHDVDQGTFSIQLIPFSEEELSNMEIHPYGGLSFEEYKQSHITPNLQSKEFYAAMVVPVGSQNAWPDGPEHEGIGANMRISRQKVFTKADIQSFEIAAGYSNLPSDKVLRLNLTEAMAKDFGDITGAMIGEKMAIIWGEQVLLAAVIMEPITDGSVSISGLDAEVVDELQESLRFPELSVDLKLLEETIILP